MIEQPYSLRVHKDFQEQLKEVEERLANKAAWAQIRLAEYGRTSVVKSTKGHTCLWRRSPIEGNHYYLWWIPAGSSCAKQFSEDRVIYIRAIRHHDETDDKLDLGGPEDYHPVELADLDPRFDDQKEVSPQYVNSDGVIVLTMDGAPGSGKTVALQFAARDGVLQAGRPAMYVTYTRQLAEAAKRLFNVQGIADRVQVFTLTELLDHLSGSQRTSTVSASLQAFKDEFSNNPSRAGTWKDDLDLLWIEINAYILGMALPFPWTRQGLVDEIPSGDMLDEKSYLALRARVVGDNAARDAYRVAEGLSDEEKERFFLQQMQAQQILKDLDENKLQEKLGKVGTLMVDEVQDFTIRQIAVLGRIAVALSKENKPFQVNFAGDESQTILPSGFDWAVTKDFCYDHLSTAKQFEFAIQRRSPVRVSQIVRASTKLYEYCEESHRPQHIVAQAEMEESGSGHASEVIRWLVNRDEEDVWRRVLEAAAEHTDLAIIDLTEEGWISSLAEGIEPEPLRDKIRSRLFTRDSILQIKGLERSIVIVAGLDEVLAQIVQRKGRKSELLLRSLRKRQLVDQVRVALSRSTQTLILAEEQDSRIPFEFDLEDQLPRTSDEVLEVLKSLDLDELEQIYNLLDQTKDFIDQGDFERAELLNRQVSEKASGWNEQDIIRQIEAQRREILTGKARLASDAILQHLEKGEFAEAKDEFSGTRNLLEQVSGLDDGIAGKVERIKGDLALWEQIEMARRSVNNKEEVLQAFEKYVHDIEPGLKDTSNEHLKRRASDLRGTFKAKNEEIYKAYGKSAREFREAGAWEKAAKHYSLAAKACDIGEDRNWAEFYHLLALRYSSLRPSESVDVAELVEFINRFEKISGTLNDGRDRKMASAVQELGLQWVEEFLDALAKDPAQYANVREHIEFPRYLSMGYSSLKEARILVIRSMREKGYWQYALELIRNFATPEYLKEDLDDLGEAEVVVETWRSISQKLTPAEREEITKLLISEDATPR